MQDTLHEIWKTSTEEDALRGLENIEVAPNNTASTQGIANFVARSLQNDFAQAINNVLAKHRREKDTYYIDLRCRLRGWVVNNHPAVSISITSELKYKGNLKTYLATCNRIDQLKGLHVIDKTKPTFETSMTITEIVGKLGENNTRTRLLAFKTPPEMTRLIEQAPDDELVIKLDGKYDYIINALQIRIHSSDYPRFKIKENLQIPALERAGYIKSVASIIQSSGLISRAYSANTHKDLFLNGNDIGYNPKLQIFNGKIVNPNSILRSLKEFGLYKSSTKREIRIGILNTVHQLSLNDLRENLRNELGNGMQYKLILATEKEVSNTSRRVLDSIIAEIAESNPDIILGIIPSVDDTVEWTPYDEFKHLTLKRNLQSQVVQPQNAGNPYIIGNVVLGILAKTGNLPYVLADPITYADLVVGLDVARQKKRNLPGTMNSAGMARIYFANGELMRYSIRETMLEGEIIPPRILHDIFPQNEFSGKKILIHRDGMLPESERKTLIEWGEQIGATFYFVEVIKSGTPRLYASQNSQIVKAPKGSIFKLSETEASLVSSEFPAGFRATPQPIRVRTYPPFTLEHALHSVLSLTLLHYGSLRPPRLPVTTHYADKISSMAVKGLKPDTLDGSIPFWL